MKGNEDILIKVIASRAYKNVLGELYYCVVALYVLDGVLDGFKVHTDWMPDDKFTENVEYLKTAKINPHLPRLFIDGPDSTPSIIPFDLKKGEVHRTT